MFVAAAFGSVSYPSDVSDVFLAAASPVRHVCGTIYSWLLKIKNGASDTTTTTIKLWQWF